MLNIKILTAIQKESQENNKFATSNNHTSCKSFCLSSSIVFFFFLFIYNVISSLLYFVVTLCLLRGRFLFVVFLSLSSLHEHVRPRYFLSGRSCFSLCHAFLLYNILHTCASLSYSFVSTFEEIVHCHCSFL